MYMPKNFCFVCLKTKTKSFGRHFLIQGYYNIILLLKTIININNKCGKNSLLIISFVLISKQHIDLS